MYMMVAGVLAKVPPAEHCCPDVRGTVAMSNGMYDACDDWGEGGSCSGQPSGSVSLLTFSAMWSTDGILFHSNPCIFYIDPELHT